jgi:hypothetical protein
MAFSRLAVTAASGRCWSLAITRNGRLSGSGGKPIA